MFIKKEDNIYIIYLLKGYLKYFGDEEVIDIKIQIHLDCTFLSLVNYGVSSTFKDLYYYKGKYYTSYQDMIDSNVIYHTNDILKEGIKLI